MAVNITQLDPNTLNTQTYELQDTNLISSFEIDTTLTPKSRIEFFIYDLNQSLISSELNYTQYSVLNDGQSSLTNNISQIIIDPAKDLENLGFTQGEYITYYNFLNNEIGSNIEPLYISEISFDRTELRLDSTVLSPQDIVEFTNNFIQKRESSEYFFDFYLNFGDNIKLIANNILLDNEDPSDPTILIKLYEPLPLDIYLNSTLWVVSTIDDSLSYQVSFIEEPIVFDDTIKIQGPNFNIELKDRVNNSTQELSYSDILNSSLTTSQNQINSLLEEKELDINIDYTNFSDFIHFSSAQTRLENFYYKVSLIEQYSSSIAIIESNITGSTSSSFAVSESKTIFENKISDIITNFDGWDYYLYYSSGSWAWPKTTTEPPYLLASTGSAAVISWYSNIIQSASLFDNSNKDNLIFSIPEYLRDDSENRQYELFIDMVAQHFDNIWIYYKDVTQKYNNDNRLDYGISKDIVADAIRDFGIKLYQNNFSNEDLYTAFLGLTPEGALFPFPNITGSLPTPSGFEYVDTLISASNDYIPLDDVNKSLYKRIYHNLPYLLKAKGTIPGLRALITSYGIPDTILRINEYGGKDKVNSNDWDYWQNEFNYAFYTEGNNFISSSFSPLNPSWPVTSTPESLLFRFKTNGLPTTNIPYSQSLFSKQSDTAHIVLRYTGSGYISGSYSGSIIDPYYQYAYLDFYPSYVNSPTVSASVYLPFFDEGWWSVMVNVNTSSNPSDYDFSLYAANKIYEGGDNGTILGFIASSSITTDGADWDNNGDVYFASSSIINGNIYAQFSGSLQEIRYYTNPINEDVFKDYVMNPYSIEGNSLNSGPNELAFRASLGGELYTGSTSIHPKVTGSWTPTSSFTSDSNFYFDSTPVFVPNTEYFFYDQPIAGIKNTVSDKIRIEDNTLPTGSTLSPFRRLEQVIEASSSYTPNINYLEVAFSPQNEINEDIMDQLGFFNIGDYIGDPNERFSGNSYPNLDNLRNAYFEKYTKNYNLVDFIRLIKFFDNSLFKMIRDFVPARTSLASGIVIKQHLLERNKYPQPQMEWEDITYTGSIEIGDVNGGTGGSFEIFNGVNTSPYGPNGTGPENIFGITQSWVETTPSLLGEVSTTHDSQEEFYDGEFQGSVILVTTQSINQPYPLENKSFEYTPILYTNTLYGLGPISQVTEGQFLNSLTTPSSGEILILAPRVKKITLEKTSGYLKIHKFDCNGNDNSIPLGQLNKILIKYTTSTTYTEYNILNISEYSTYYLYEISNQNIDTLGTGIDNEIKDYLVSSSVGSSYPLSQSSFPQLEPTTQVITGWTSIVGNSLGYFNTSSGYYTLLDTPNIPLSITASLITSGSTGAFRLMLLRQGDYSTLVSNPLSAGSSVTTTISSSYFGLKGDQLFLRAYGIFSNQTLISSSLLITQSISPTASVCDPIIIEPYISVPNFYNSDQNALLNDVSENRVSTIYQDIDYNTGILTPTNFDLLISGSAVKAAVQDSNYTTARHIIPRYEGSKSTSQFLNKWTSGDQGTFGKTPTVESLKNYVAYCDFIGGWPPERMNASGAHILYLIKDDGTVVIPNTSENSLNINKGTYESGERVSIEAKVNSNTGDTNFRNIIRGGTRIEPILYTQIGHSIAQWTSSINLISSLPIQDTSSYGDYQAKFKPPAQVISNNNSSFTTINFNNQIYLGSGASWATNAYSVTNDVILDGINLTFSPRIIFNFLNNIGGTSPARNIYVTSRLVRLRSSVVTILDEQSLYFNLNSNTTTAQYIIDHLYSIASSDLQVNDQYYVTFQQYTTNPATSAYPGSYSITISPSSLFSVFQDPAPTDYIIYTTGSNTVWGYPDPITYPQIITSSNPVLTSAYGNPDIKQQDIPGSGFNSITLPWSLKIGDEFRFEGKESETYLIKNIYAPGEEGNGRLFNTSSLEVHFSSPLPISSSTNIFNLNHFLIRRYVDDASLILLEGFKPIGSEGPFILKPEYCSPELNRDIDQFILDLTQKGLL